MKILLFYLRKNYQENKKRTDCINIILVDRLIDKNNLDQNKI